MFVEADLQRSRSFRDIDLLVFGSAFMSCNDSFMPTLRRTAASSFGLLIGTALVAMPDPANAANAQTTPAQQQPTAPPPQAEAPARVEDVTVTARSSDIRTSIEATSHSVADDLQSATGTLADALRNIPSVDVGPTGELTLRGDPGVTVLVDGRPSALLSGEGRGQALLQLPADRYTRIEVMTNPSAAYRPDGSGGIINLITGRSPGRTGATTLGSVRANSGGDGRYNLGVNVSNTKDQFVLTGDLGLRHDGVRQETVRRRDRLNAATGRFDGTRQTMVTDGYSDSVIGRLGVEYNPNTRIQLVGELRHSRSDSNAFGDELYETARGGDWVPAYSRAGDRDSTSHTTGVTARLLNRFDDQGHEWTHELRYDRAYSNSIQTNRLVFTAPVAPPDFERLDYTNRNVPIGFTSAYVRPMSGEALLRLGYELDRNTADYDHRVLRGPTDRDLTFDPRATNRFEADQTVHAVYATYQRPFGRLTALFGLRLEQAQIEVDQITSGERRSGDYFRAYPTLNLSYRLTETDTLRASYSRRIQRPQLADLNPFLVYQDPQNFRSGNPDLEPQTTDSFEAVWQRRVGQTFYQTTLYHRDTRDAFTYAIVDLGGGVLLSRFENLGARTLSGLEATGSGQLHRTLRYNASINVYHQEIRSSGIPDGADRSGSTVSGRLSLNWQPTQTDFVQLSGLWFGDSLNAQGTRTGSALINLGYRRKLSESLSFQATVRDLLDDFGEVVTYETPILRDLTERLFGGRVAFIGLTWTFGQGQRRPEQFDFSSGPGEGS